MRPDAILASNTSSISITKIASAAIPEGVSPASEEGKKSAGRVVGMVFPLAHDNTEAIILIFHIGLHFFNPVPVMVGASSSMDELKS